MKKNIINRFILNMSAQDVLVQNIWSETSSQAWRISLLGINVSHDL